MCQLHIIATRGHGSNSCLLSRLIRNPVRVRGSRHYCVRAKARAHSHWAQAREGVRTGGAYLRRPPPVSQETCLSSIGSTVPGVWVVVPVL